MQHKHLIDDNDSDIAYILETHPDLTPDILFEEIDGKFTLRKQSIKNYVYSKFSRMNDLFNLELLSKYIYYLHAECVKKSKVQGKVYDALVAFGWRFIGEKDITENLSGEVNNCILHCRLNLRNVAQFIVRQPMTHHFTVKIMQ